MKWRILFGLVAAGLPGAPAATGSAPQIETISALSALPVEFADGKSGPVNRYAFELSGFVPGEDASVVCVYPGGFTYRCAHEFAGANGGLERVVVAIPDLDRGKQVRVRFANSLGQANVEVRITNGLRLIHEIESISLPDGGATRVGGDGQPAIQRHLLHQIASTVPAVAMRGPRQANCDDIYAIWESAEASNPVFVSTFGALHGGITSAGGMQRGARVNGQTLPRWLVTYPRSATRVQFIAHYEVSYRVGTCADRALDG
jgi:hypothetical protein